MTASLYYVHDPMCSWCYAFGPTWARIRESLPPGLPQRRLLGGLAPDTDEPMPADLCDYLQGTWRRIETAVPGTWFNHDYWTRCRPRRATYRSCRAVIAARNQDPSLDEPMTRAIQQAYYQQARNPSDAGTLIDLAVGLGLDGARFAAELDAPATRAALAREIAEARHIGADSFPSLVVVAGDDAHPLPLDYNNADVMVRRILSALADVGGIVLD